MCSVGGACGWLGGGRSTGVRGGGGRERESERLQQETATPLSAQQSTTLHIKEKENKI